VKLVVDNQSIDYLIPSYTKLNQDFTQLHQTGTSTWSSTKEKEVKTQVTSNVDDSLLKIFKFRQTFESGQTSTQEVVVNKTWYYHKLYQLSLGNEVRAKPRLHDEFYDRCIALPSKWTNKEGPTKELYLEFVNLFGTHVISSCEFGGFVELTKTYDSTAEKYISDMEVTSQLDFKSLGTNVSLGMGVNSQRSQALSECLKSETFSIAPDMKDIVDMKTLSENKKDWYLAIRQNPRMLQDTIAVTPLVTYFPLGPRNSTTYATQDHKPVTEYLERKAAFTAFLKDYYKDFKSSDCVLL